METSIPSKTPNPSMIKNQPGNNKELSRQSLHKSSDHLSGNNSIKNASDKSVTESEDGSLFNPSQACHPPSPPPREPLKILLCLKQGHAKRGLPQKALTGFSHPPLEIHNVGNQTRSNKFPPSEKADKPAPFERREPDFYSLAGKAGLDIKAQQPNKKSELAKNPTGKKRG
ncbi:hypothetical protein PCANC_03093 [Puccinia coronata f. sp. avenae]|uniref:Uncharacterized protein n=1 Tax=Puccinia coronata f. sp. avenae TaxID=200324 RepID=A0A2N5W4K4_9BASI|nr:hypothetical protein PCANC_03093 [Puccinia coronata f. sp. avenae]